MRQSTQTLAWYDRLAVLYNVTRDYPYGTARRHAIDRLALGPGECVFDLFCGTGVNLPLLHERVSPAGRVVGVDGSSAMLAKAQRAWQHLNSMELVQLDFSDPGCRRALQEQIRADRPAAFLFTLGLTCLRDWSAFFASVFDAADPAERPSAAYQFLPVKDHGLVRMVVEEATLEGLKPREYLIARVLEFDHYASQTQIAMIRIF